MKRIFTLRGLFLLAYVSVGGAASATESSASSPPERHFSAFVDPLGFLLFGSRAGVEAGGDHLAGAVYARWFDAGLASRKLFLRDGDTFRASWGAGVRGRYYLSSGQSGIHVGAGAEYLRARIDTPSARVAAISSYAVPYAEGGYRLPLGRFYVGAAAVLGYAVRLSGHVENLPGGMAAATYEATNKSSVYGWASLELGLFL
jgi:hypothetical protein